MISTYLGCGALGTGPDTFALYVNGIDYSDPAKNAAGASIELSTLSLSRNVATNATAGFTIHDPFLQVAIPAYADVWIWEHPSGGTERVLYSGIVSGQAITQEGIGRNIDVRCVDYGALLDKRKFYAAPAQSGVSTQEIVQQVFGQMSGTGPISALGAPASAHGVPSGDLRIACGSDGSVGTYAPWESSSGTLRAALDALAASTYFADATVANTYLPAPCFVYVDALRRLNVYPMTANLGAAPKEIVDTTPGAGQANAENLSLDDDYLDIQNELEVTDTDTGSGNYGGVVVGDRTYANGYALAGSATQALNLVAAGQYLWFGSATLAGGLIFGRTAGTFDIETTDHWDIGQVVTITSAAHGLSARPFVIQSVGTQFVGGDGKRIASVSFGGAPSVTASGRGAPANTFTRRVRSLLASVGG